MNVIRKLAQGCKYPAGGDCETLAKEVKQEKERRINWTSDAGRDTERGGKTRSGDMRGAMQTLTGEGVLECKGHTARELRW